MVSRTFLTTDNFRKSPLYQGSTSNTGMQRLYVFYILFLPGLLSAQYSPTVISGRPGQSLGALTVGRDVYQVETGLNVHWIGDGEDRRRNLSEITDIRIGISEKLELNALIEGASVESIVPLGRSFERGISDTQIGARYNFFENAGWRPTLALQGRMLLTAQDEAFRRERLGAYFILAAEWGLTDLLGLTLNLNQIWTGDRDRSTDYAVTLGYSLSDRWSSFVEAYGTFSDGFTADYDAGVAYLVTDDVSLDFSGGWDGDATENSYYVDFGISFRFDGHTVD